MAQGIQSLLSDRVPQVLLHLPRKREQRSSLHEHLQEDSEEHLEEKICPSFRASMQKGKLVPWSNLLCGLCFLWGQGLQRHHGHQVHPRRGKPQIAALNLHRSMENCLENKCTAHGLHLPLALHNLQSRVLPETTERLI